MAPEKFSIEKFSIHVSEAVLEDLRRRLDATRWPDQPAGGAWELGTDLDYMKSFVAHWRHRYDWRAAEAVLNQLPQYRIVLDGLPIHFVHVRGRGVKPLPLIVSHGWPGCFAEMTKILPLLTDPAAHGGDARDAFDVVVPSLPGYGFSGVPATRGMGGFEIAGLWVRLMAELGYQRFGAQGGDWGATISTALGLEHPRHLIGVHLNFVPGSYVPHLGRGLPEPTDEELGYLDAIRAWRGAEGAYNQLQSTKPQTLGYGLNDSPVGLAAWIVEKFRAWSDCDGDLERCFTKDELITNIMIYWATQTIASSMRIYNEARRRPLQFSAGQRVTAAVGVAVFPKEIPMPPRSWVERGYNVAHWTIMPKGGHFAAMEQPALLAEDIRRFFRTLR
jgi:pimeloyl-ACP methyl ester carboxylesterase